MYAKELRLKVVQTLREQGPMPLVDLVQRVPLQATPMAIARTVENAVRAGVLEKVGHEKRPHCNKWVALYDVPEPQAEEGATQVHDGGMVVLAGALSSWR